MENYLVIWPKSKDVIHINYHYTDFGEIVDYLCGKFPNQIIPMDCDVGDVNDLAILLKSCNVKKVAMMVNYENVENAFQMAEDIKNEVDIPVMAYGNLTVNFPHLFLNSNFDVIYNSGDYQKGIEAFFNGYPDIKKMKGLIKLGNGLFQFLHMIQLKIKIDMCST